MNKEGSLKSRVDVVSGAVLAAAFVTFQVRMEYGVLGTFALTASRPGHLSQMPEVFSVKLFTVSDSAFVWDQPVSAQKSFLVQSPALWELMGDMGTATVTVVRKLCEIAEAIQSGKHKPIDVKAFEEMTGLAEVPVDEDIFGEEPEEVPA